MDTNEAKKICGLVEPLEGTAQKVIADHIARLEAALTYKQTMLEGAETEIRQREDQDKAYRIQIDLLEARNAELEDQAAAQAGGVVVARKEFWSGGYPDLGVRRHRTPASRVLGEGSLQIIRDALAYSKPQMAHYPEPVERHANALKIVEDALRAAKGGEP